MLHIAAAIAPIVEFVACRSCSFHFHFGLVAAIEYLATATHRTFRARFRCRINRIFIWHEYGAQCGVASIVNLVITLFVGVAIVPFHKVIAIFRRGANAYRRAKRCGDFAIDRTTTAARIDNHRSNREVARFEHGSESGVGTMCQHFVFARVARCSAVFPIVELIARNALSFHRNGCAKIVSACVRNGTKSVFADGLHLKFIRTEMRHKSRILSLHSVGERFLIERGVVVPMVEHIAIFRCGSNFNLGVESLFFGEFRHFAAVFIVHFCGYGVTQRTEVGFVDAVARIDYIIYGVASLVRVPMVEFVTSIWNGIDFYARLIFVSRFHRWRG